MVRNPPEEAERFFLVALITVGPIYWLGPAKTIRRFRKCRSEFFEIPSYATMLNSGSGVSLMDYCNWCNKKREEINHE